MKKLFTLLFVAAAVAASAQSISFVYNSEPLANGDTITYYYTGAEIGEMISEPHVGYTYNGTVDAEFIVFKTDIQINPDNMVQFCLGECYNDTSSVIAMPVGTSYSDRDELAFHANYFAFEPGTALIKFTFRNVNDLSDQSSFYVKYTEALGVQDHVVAALNAYPNPATTGVTIEYAGVDNNSMIVMQNLTGAVVFQQAADRSGKMYVNTSNLKPGVYFYGVSNKGQMTNVKKLVIK